MPHGPSSSRYAPGIAARTGEWVATTTWDHNWASADPHCGFSPYASARLSTTVDFPDPFSPTSTVSPAGSSSPSRNSWAMAGTLAGHTN